METTFTSQFGTHTALFNSSGHCYVELGDITVNSVAIHGNLHVHLQPDGAWKPCPPDQAKAWGAHSHAPGSVYLHRKGSHEDVSSSAKKKVAVAISAAITKLANERPELPHAGAMQGNHRDIERAEAEVAELTAALKKAQKTLADARIAMTALNHAAPHIGRAA